MFKWRLRGLVRAGRRNDEDPQAFPREPGLLVHGERRAYGLCDVLLAAVPDCGGRRSMVAAQNLTFLFAAPIPELEEKFADFQG
jgi:hypothetical protein